MNLHASICMLPSPACMHGDEKGGTPYMSADLARPSCHTSLAPVSSAPLSCCFFGKDENGPSLLETHDKSQVTTPTIIQPSQSQAKNGGGQVDQLLDTVCRLSSRMPDGCSSYHKKAPLADIDEQGLATRPVPSYCYGVPVHTCIVRTWDLGAPD